MLGDDQCCAAALPIAQTDGGGWTIFHSITGNDNENTLTSNGEAGGNPLLFQHFSLNRAKKVALSTIMDETLFYRGRSMWLKVDKPAFDSALNAPNSHNHQGVSIVANDGSVATGYMGYSNYWNAYGGDFALTNGAGIDHHSSSYYHLNGGCANSFLYSYSAAAGDSDAGYDCNTGLGPWTVTRSCDSAEGGGLAFYAAMRERRKATQGTIRGSCKEYLVADANAVSGKYTVKINGIEFDVFCDMKTDGGGWMVFSSFTGADGEMPLTSDDERTGGNPMFLQHFNINRAKKMAIASISKETLLWRATDSWLVVDHAAFDSALGSGNSHVEWTVNVRSADGTSSPGIMGYSNYWNAYGGDFVLTNGAGIDHHSSSYYHLNGGCASSYLYSYSAGAGDGDAGYDVSAQLGTWTTTTGCNSAEGGLLKFFAGMRESRPTAGGGGGGAALPKSCREILAKNSDAQSGQYQISSGGYTWNAWCDMKTDSGGWTVMYAVTGADGEEPIVGGKEQNGNPLLLQHYNTNRAIKAAVAAWAKETLVWRAPNNYLLVDHEPWDAGIASANTHQHWQVSVHAQDGTNSGGFMGYTTYNYAYGGDFAITNMANIDHHSSSYFHLNGGCANSFLYSYSAVAGDYDAGYDVNTALGNWDATHSCASDEGSAGRLRFYLAVREGKYLGENNPKSCREILIKNRLATSGKYVIDPDGNGEAFETYCDMVTDGGGWTVVNGISGQDGEQPLVSDVATHGNPLQFIPFNLRRAHKMAIARLSSQTLFLREGNKWLQIDKAIFDDKLDSSNYHQHSAVNIRSSSGATATGVSAYSNFNYQYGGDYALTNTASVDHHTGSYYHLNSGCQNSFIYSYSSASGDWDAGYDVNTALGDWAATHSCHSDEGSSGRFKFYTAMREGPVPEASVDSGPCPSGHYKDEVAWTRVAEVKPQTTASCPSGWTYASSPSAMCQRPCDGSCCASTVWSVPNSAKYDEVKGYVIGYAQRTVDGFQPSGSIDNPYLEGVSITTAEAGGGRKHIWSFGAGYGDNSQVGTANCPCNGGDGPPSFVGSNWYCESGVGSASSPGSSWLTGDPLWDGQGCFHPSNTCCQKRTGQPKGQPWFYTRVAETTQSVEARICLDQAKADEDLAVLEMELYVRKSAGPAGDGESSCKPCPAGVYGATEGLEASDCTGACPTGSYCVEGTKTPTPCPAGKFGATTGLKTRECSGDCPAGHFCPEGTKVGTANKCPAGSWGSTGQTQNTCSGTCAAGYFCVAGSTSDKPTKCGAGNYCPAGSSAATKIQDGYYGSGGDADTRVAELPCPRGAYCKNGVMTPCAAGLFGAKVLESDPGCSGKCQAGFFCDAGSSTPTQGQCRATGEASDSVLSYCPEGTATILTAAEGFYTVPEDAPKDQRTGVVACLSSEICAAGARKPRIEWLDAKACAEGTKVLPVDEDTKDAVAGTMAAKKNFVDANALVYALTKQTVDPAAKNCALAAPFAVDAASGKISSSAAIDFEVCPSYAVTVEAKSGATSITCDIKIAVNNANDPPTFSQALYEVDVDELSKVGTVVSDKLVATDPDIGQELYFTIKDGNVNNFFKISQCSGTLMINADGLKYTDYMWGFNLTVTAGDDGSPVPLSAETKVHVTVNDLNDPPSFTADDFGLTVPENSPVGTAVGTVAASDPDGDRLTFSLKSNVDNAFDIDASTGVISLKDSPTGASMNFEIKNLYAITVEVSDGRDPPLKAQLATTVRVSDVNDAPVIYTTPLSVKEMAAKDTRVGDPIFGTDEDFGTKLTWSITGGNTDGFFTFNPSSSQIAVAKDGLDYEVVSTYSLTVRATDDGLKGDGKNVQYSEVTLVVNLINVNEAPVMGNYDLYINETNRLNQFIRPNLLAVDPDNVNSIVQSITYFMEAGDPEVFRVDPLSGAVVALQSLDYETTNTYVIKVVAVDNGQPPLQTALVTVTIHVLDVDEPPTMESPQYINVNEGSAPGTKVGAALVCSDPDGGPGAGAAISFRIDKPLLFNATDGKQYPMFAVDSAGQVTVAGNAGSPATVPVLDAERAPSYNFPVVCTDGSRESVGIVYVDILNVNEAPTLPNQYLEVAEKTPAGTVVSAPLKGVDQDKSDQEPGALLYSIVSGSEAPSSCLGMFVFADPNQSGQADGRVKLTKQAPLVTEPTCSFRVRVQDRGGLFGVGNVFVNWTDTNLFPVMADQSASLPENAKAGDVVVADLGATDADTEQTLRFTIANAAGWSSTDRAAGTQLEGDFGTLFAVSPGSNGRGKLTVRGFGGGMTGLDYEFAKLYDVEIEVEDNGPGRLRTTGKVSISITNVNEPPSVSVLGVNIPENTPIGTFVVDIVAQDADAGDSATFALLPDSAGGQISAGAALPFSVDKNTGKITVSGVVDYEERSSWPMVAQATDSGGLSATQSFVITVLNVNEPVTMDNFVVSVPENVTVGDLIANAEATDPDARNGLATVMYWFTAGNEDGLFSIGDNTGLILLAQPLDYEDRKQHVLTIFATDTEYNATATCTVNVLDVMDVTIDSFVPPVHNSGQRIFIAGSNFGPTARSKAAGASAPSVSAVYGPSGNPTAYTATDCAVSAGGNSEIRCNTTVGAGTGLRWRVTVGGLTVVSKPDLTTAYTPPVITSTSGGTSMSTEGGASLTLRGKSFGTIGSAVEVRYGTYTAAECYVTGLDKVTCTSVAGVGAGLDWQLKAGGQWSPKFSDGSGYASPAISAVTLPIPPPASNPTAPATDGVDKLETGGGQTVTVTGTNFGPSGTKDITASYGVAIKGASGDALTEIKYTITCTVSVAHKELKCVTAPGVGAGHRWQLEVGGQSGAVSAAAVTSSYAKPVISAVSGEGAVEASTRGGERVVLTGTNFGAAFLVGFSVSATYSRVKTSPVTHAIEPAAAHL